MAALVSLLLLLAFTGHSSALYCVCKDGQSDSVLQKNIDYACGNGADCTAILQSGACYNPNTVKDHCSYAVNSYYQKKSSLGATCDFGGTATTTTTLSTQSSGCSYSSGSSTSTPTSTNTPPSGSSSAFNTTSLAPTAFNDSSRAATARHTRMLFWSLGCFSVAACLLQWG